MMKNTVILTSINPPTPAVAQFAALPDWDVLVVGDLKTPHDWHCPVTVQFVRETAEKRCRLKSFQPCPGIIMPVK
jgi:hypothetical protein